MAEDGMFKRVTEPDDPNRCQSIGMGGNQCINVATPGSKYCHCHNGNRTAIAADRLSLKNYRLNKFYLRAQEMGEAAQIKNLRDEIGILRMTLEEKLNMCQSPMELILQSGAISDLVVKIEKLVSSCHKLEEAVNSTLDKTVVMNIADTIVSILGNRIEDKALLETIVNEIAQSLQTPNE